MRRYSKNFFTKNRAKEFMEALKNNGAENVELWEGLDGFRQPQYTVKWD